MFDHKFEDSLNAHNVEIYFAFLGGLAEKLQAITSLVLYHSVYKKTFCGGCNSAGIHALHKLSATANYLHGLCDFKDISDEIVSENFNKVTQMSSRTMSQLNCAQNSQTQKGTNSDDISCIEKLLGNIALRE